MNLKQNALLALGLLPAAAYAHGQAATQANESKNAAVQGVDETLVRVQEAAHLNVPPSCKWGHAAFEPVQVASEPLSPEAQALYAQMESA